MSTNFKDFNPGLTNAEADGAYENDATRTGGAQPGAILPSGLFNKFAHQTARMVAALATALDGKGISTSDSDWGSLVTALSRIRTDAPADQNIVAVYGVDSSGTVAAQFSNALEKADAAAGPITRTLYSVTGHSGWQVTIKKVDSSANPVTVDGGGANIDGANSVVLPNHRDLVTLVCDGFGWDITSGVEPT